jgi:hypothetical protein
MTLHASRSGQQVTVHGNLGVDLEVRNSQVTAVHITEQAQHAEYFHKQLGDLLAEAKAEREDNA